MTEGELEYGQEIGITRCPYCKIKLVKGDIASFPLKCHHCETHYRVKRVKPFLIEEPKFDRIDRTMPK